ncbi:MAG: DoxX family protein [Acidimicrobiia bacterium]|jgi:putative oxidoreductase
MEPIDLALTVLRLWLGIVMLAHGVHHARNLEGTAAWFASKGFRQPPLNARASAFGELAIGAGLVTGLLTSPAAAGLIATMTVAFGSIHRFAGFFVFKRPDEGWEYVATLAVASLTVAVAGPGPYSLDAVLGIDTALSGWTGLAIALAGVAAGAVQLAVFWRRPTSETP